MNIAAVLASTNVDSLVRHAAGALVSSLWQGIALACVIALCLRLVPSASARIRFAVWMAAFAVLATLPFANAALVGHLTPAAPPGAPIFQLAPGWSYLLAGLWIVAVLVRLGYLALQAIKLRSLWHSAVPVSDRAPVDPHLFHKHVQVCTSIELDRPGVIGFFAPRILIPEWLYDQLTPVELNQIILHEVEHLRRRDDWINLFQKIGLTLFPLNPALFWIDRHLATERELACDDGVLSRTHAPVAYATCLTSLAERRLEHRRTSQLTVLALGAVGAIRRSDFTRRIESILGFGWRSELNPVPARTLATTLIVGVLGASVALTRAPQLVSFTAAARPQAAVMLPRPALDVNTNRQFPSAKYENAVFHGSSSTAGNLPSPGIAKKHKLKPRNVASTVQVDTVYSESTQQRSPRLMLLTSWQEATPQPVFVTLPDGRTFLTTYAASPNQAGWLLIQL